MKNLKNQKGITLVALVVTIIVLLILAGVSLSLVAGGNGIISKSVKAVDETNEGAAKEQAELKVTELVADYYEAKYVDGTATEADALAYIKANAQDYTVGGYTVKITAAGAISVTKGDSTDNIVEGTIGENGKVEWTEPTA